MRYSFIFLFLTISYFHDSQILKCIERDTSISSKNIIILNGNLDYSASALRNTILNPLILGGFISDEMKSNAQLNHKSFNMLGFNGQADVQMYFSNHSKKPLFQRYMPGFSYKQVAQGSLAYPTPLFNLIMYGNDYFLGEYINISGTQLKFYQYQSLGFSIMDRKTQSNVSINFVGLTNYLDVELGGRYGQMNFYYSEVGDSLYGIVQGKWSKSNSPAYFKGIGASIDAEYRFPVEFNGGILSSMQLSISNLGFVYMQDWYHQSIDTSFAFGGFTLTEAMDREGILDPDFDYTDSLTETGTNTKIKLLPCTFQFSNVVDLLSSHKVQPMYGFRIVTLPGYIPYIYGGSSFRLSKKMQLGTCLSYGGFSGLKFNASYTYSSENLSVGIASENLYGLIFNSGFGRSLSLRLRCDL